MWCTTNEGALEAVWCGARRADSNVYVFFFTKDDLARPGFEARSGFVHALLEKSDHQALWRGVTTCCKRSRRT